ncbi:MAG: hypothetical protein ABI376_02925 [Caulobacteraceae bacterium]
MASRSIDHAADEAKSATAAAGAAVDHGQRAFNDALGAAERMIADAARTAEKILKESVESLRAHTKSYTGNAGQHVDEAQRYVMDKVKERPMTATLAGLGVGLLLGLLLSSRGK